LKFCIRYCINYNACYSEHESLDMYVE